MSDYYHGTTVLDFIREFNLNFALGNVIKYVARCDSKDNALADLHKALDYLTKEIEYRESRKSESHPSTPVTPIIPNTVEGCSKR